MYSKTKHIPLLLFILLISFTGISQNTETATDTIQKSNFDIGVDVQSRYIWRGIMLGGNTASIQPYVEYSTGIFAFGVWGAYAVGGDAYGQEADLYLTISPLDFLSFTVTDYFFPTDLESNNYFDYSNKTTGHVFELMASFSSEKFPIGFTVATNFTGADQDSNGDQSFSTYVEANYGTAIKSVDISLFAGAVFSDNGSYYGTDGSGFINLGISASKEIKITEHWNLPVNAALIFNPDAENIFITFGFTL